MSDTQDKWSEHVFSTSDAHNRYWLPGEKTSRHMAKELRVEFLSEAEGDGLGPTRAAITLGVSFLPDLISYAMNRSDLQKLITLLQETALQLPKED